MILQLAPMHWGLEERLEEIRVVFLACGCIFFHTMMVTFLLRLFFFLAEVLP